MFITSAGLKPINPVSGCMCMQIKEKRAAAAAAAGGGRGGWWPRTRPASQKWGGFDSFKAG